MAAVEGRAVGQVRIVFSPDEFRWVEFRGIRREPFHVKPETPSQIVFDFLALMDRPVVPKKDDGSPELSEQVLQERKDVQSREIVRAQPDIERQAFPFWGYSQRIEGRNPVLLIKIFKENGLPP